jgi:MoaA/NifB/PqqE/SkfB family radical SAM enzyme
MRLLRKTGRKVRSVRKFVRGLVDTEHPLLVHIIPIRRCNIDCGYCNEYDQTSLPVPLDEMKRRVAKLAELGTSVVAMSGGEPMLHPDLDEIIRAIRADGMIAGLITNGYLISPKRIQELNEAGLDYLQISIDNVEPDEVSKKSLRLLDGKLRWLAEHAHFDVNINSVVGGGIKHPGDARVINQRARDLGFSTSVGIIHDGSGLLKPLAPTERAVYDDVSRRTSSVAQIAQNLYSGIRGFQDNLADGKPNTWWCRAGARYLYICEDGLVHWCSQQRGYPGLLLERYGPADLEREYGSVKSCAPFCTVGCVHRVAQVNELRASPLAVLESLSATAEGQAAELSAPVRLLVWMFFTSRRRDLFRRTAQRLLGVG